MILDSIHKKMKSHNYILSTGELLDIGMSKTTLTNYVKEGLLERCGHGYYTMPDAIEDDMYLVMLRSKHIIFSHETALFLNGISERTPFVHSVTIPSNAAIPSSIKDQCKCYYVKAELHEIGLTEKETTFGNLVRCYDPERTICDMVRSKSSVDMQSYQDALKEYGRRSNKNLSNLLAYARLFHIEKKVRLYLEVLL